MPDSKAHSGSFTGYDCRVGASVIDYNGHMNDAAYAQVLADANEAFLSSLGLSAAYRASGYSMYTVETTIRFLREVRLNNLLRAESRLASHDQKRARIHTVLANEDGIQVANGDSLYVHVNTAVGKVVPFPPDRKDELERVQALHDEGGATR